MELATIVVLIAFTGREKFIKSNVALLRAQTHPVKIVLVGSTDKDKEIAREIKVDRYIIHPNQPLGAKWQYGLRYISNLYADVKAVIINGSDDFLSPSYVEKAYSYIKQGADLAGKMDWFIYDSKLDNAYHIDKRLYSVLGAGRIWSRKFLDKVKWEIFPIHKNNQLDSSSYDILNSQKGNYKIIRDKEMIILSLKGHHRVLNTTQAIVRNQQPLDDQTIKYFREVSRSHEEEDHIKFIYDMINLENTLPKAKKQL
tara:strand:+ start:3531 stop:4298 length:768 start_codon:yes stop_codon:yes gene_type:complete